MKAFRTVLPYLKENIWFIIGGLASLLIVDILQLLIPRIIKWVVDDLTQGKVSGTVLLIYGLKIIGLAIFICIFRFFWRYLILGTAHRIEKKLRFHFFTHLQTLPLSFFNRFSTGDIMAHATNDLNAIRMALGMALVALVDGILLSLMAIAFMVHINFLLTVFALIPAPFLVFITNQVGKKIHDRFLKVQETFSRLTEKVRENFAGIRVIKSYVQEEHRLNKLSEVSYQLVRRNMDLTRVWGLFFPMVLGFINLGFAIVLIMGGRQTILLKITPGDFVAFMSYMGILTWPMIALGWVMNILEQGAASMKRINNLLETEPEVTYSLPPANIDRVYGKVDFRNLSFSYNGGPPVLKNVSLSVNSGECVAIVGRIGSGKTTLLNLLFRLYEVNAGSIYLDENDIKHISLEKLRQHIGYVPQDTFLFSDTVKENIVFGSPQSPEDKVIEVAKVAEIYDEIMAFPHQFDTVVGERGVILSGGQKQRIAIARALLINPPVLIFDNALSSVDTHTEERIMTNLRPLISGKTTIIVTHRISSIKDADRIYVLEEGKIREQGDHETLLSIGGVYAEMFQRQLLEKELEKNSGDGM